MGEEEIVVTEQDELEAERISQLLETNRKWVEDKLEEVSGKVSKMKEWLCGKWLTDPEGFKRAFFDANDDRLNVNQRAILLQMAGHIRRQCELFTAEKIFCQHLLDEGIYGCFEDLTTPAGQRAFGNQVRILKDVLFLKGL